MSASLRFYGLSLPLMCGLVGVVLSLPRFLEALGAEAPSDAEPRPNLVGEVAATADPRCAVIWARSAAKAQVVVRLREGKLSLFEAAACFRDLNAEPALQSNAGFQFLPGSSDEEKLCRQVITWARNTKVETAQASDVAALSARLEAELDAQLLLRGRIDLPRR